jgi:hypothetical protein
LASRDLYTEPSGVVDCHHAISIPNLATSLPLPDGL